MKIYDNQWDSRQTQMNETEIGKKKYIDKVISAEAHQQPIVIAQWNVRCLCICAYIAKENVKKHVGNTLVFGFQCAK